MFFANFTDNGNLLWIEQSHADGLGGAEGYDVGQDSNGYIYTLGYFHGNASFDSLQVSSSSTGDSFIAKYNLNGNCLNVEQLANSTARSIQLDAHNDVIIAGDFLNTLTIGSTLLTSHGYADVFIAKHDAITGIRHNTKTTNNQLYIHANPNAGKCNITIPDEFAHEKNLTLSIYSNNGKLIQQKNIELTEGKIKLNLEAEAKGLYNAVLSNGVKSYSGKIVFE